MKTKKAAMKRKAARKAVAARPVDRGLAENHAALAKRAKVVLDARLALIDPGSNTDKFYVLQSLEDPSASGTGRFYASRRWGRTGTAGDSKLEGPLEESDAAAILQRIFKEKTGAAWGSIQPGDPAKPGMYWLQQVEKSDLKAKWEYYVSDRVDGKATGWYPYLRDASAEVEELYAQHNANAQGSRTRERIVTSGHFSYKVDLANMKQQNTRTSKLRMIRRTLGRSTSQTSLVGKAHSAMKVAMKVASRSGRAMKAMKAMKKKPMKKKLMKKKKAMKKVMKKPMKKVMKKAMKAVSKVAKGKAAKKLVYRGEKGKTKTPGGLTKDDLTKSKSANKIVSKTRRAAGIRKFSNISTWAAACKEAKKALGLTGFVAVKKDTPMYNKAKELMSSVKPLVRRATTKVLAPPTPVVRKASTKNLVLARTASAKSLPSTPVVRKASSQSLPGPVVRKASTKSL